MSSRGKRPKPTANYRENDVPPLHPLPPHRNVTSFSFLCTITTREGKEAKGKERARVVTRRVQDTNQSLDVTYTSKNDVACTVLRQALLIVRLEIAESECLDV